MTAISPDSSAKSAIHPPLARIRTLLIDLDGVVYRGKTVLPGAPEFFAFLSAKHFQFNLVTNNSTIRPAQYAERLAGMGIHVDASDIFTSGEAVARYLLKIASPGAGVYVIGGEGLEQPVLEAGFRIDERSPSYVLVGLDRRLSYDKLAIACLAIRKGARLIASNADKTFPAEQGLLPGAGAIVAALITCTGARPTILGKPDTGMVSLAMERLGARKVSTAILGDNLETDIRAGRRIGITTLLVLTGVTAPADLARSKIKPDYVFRDLHQLGSALGAT